MSDFFDRLDREEKDSPPPPPEGEDWDFDDPEEQRKHYPRLSHLYLVCARRRGRMTAPGFKDHFSGHALDYRAFRPAYPPELFAFLAHSAPARDLAWDCGTGNGQAAIGLAEHFASVFATDASAEQIKNAARHPKIEYAVAPAEQCPLADHSADLITVTQALHWFHLDRFYAEVRRVVPAGRLTGRDLLL